MEAKHGVEEEIDDLETGLLSDTGSGSGSGLRTRDDDGDDDEAEPEPDPVLYSASFDQVENDFVKYKTVEWVLYSLIFILAWGAGLLMFLYLPVRRHILRQHIRSRKLYFTHDAIVYKVAKPVPLPCFGVLKREKHILLPSVADVVIEQGYLQSRFGVYSIRIENVGVRRPHSDDVHIEGIGNPHAFRKAVLTHLSNMRSQGFRRQVSTLEDASHSKNIHPSAVLMSPSRALAHDSSSHFGELAILWKLEEVGSSVKKIQRLIEEQQPQVAEQLD